MIKLIKISLLLFITVPGFSQENTTYSVLLDQVEAFNTRDIDKMVSNLTGDFKWYFIGPDTLVLEISGKENFRKSMESYFDSIQEVKSEIAEFTIHKNRISFKEVIHYVTSSGKSGSTSAMGIYEMKEGLIYRAWYFL